MSAAGCGRPCRQALPVLPLKSPENLTASDTLGYPFSHIIFRGWGFHTCYEFEFRFVATEFYSRSDTLRSQTSHARDCRKSKSKTSRQIVRNIFKTLQLVYRHSSERPEVRETLLGVETSKSTRKVLPFTASRAGLGCRVVASNSRARPSFTSCSTESAFRTTRQCLEQTEAQSN